MSTPTDRQTVANARRDVHELLVTLPAWDADQVRDRIATLEKAVRNLAFTDAAELMRRSNDAISWPRTAVSGPAAANILLAARTSQEFR